MARIKITVKDALGATMYRVAGYDQKVRASKLSHKDMQDCDLLLDVVYGEELRVLEEGAGGHSLINREIGRVVYREGWPLDEVGTPYTEVRRAE